MSAKLRIVAAAALDRSCASARPITGGPSKMIRSNTSSPTESSECSRGLDKRSAAFGGSGPVGMNAKFGTSVACIVSGGEHDPVR